MAGLGLATPTHEELITRSTSAVRPSRWRSSGSLVVVLVRIPADLPSHVRRRISSTSVFTRPGDSDHLRTAPSASAPGCASPSRRARRCRPYLREPDLRARLMLPPLAGARRQESPRSLPLPSPAVAGCPWTAGSSGHPCWTAGPLLPAPMAAAAGGPGCQDRGGRCGGGSAAAARHAVRPAASRRALGRGETTTRSNFGYTDWDVADRPQVVIWEATRACALACRHCRASAQRRPRPDELRTDEARGLLRQIAAVRPQIFVITGGDPLERPDLFDLMEDARALGLRVSVAPSVTPLLHTAALEHLARAGCAGIQLSLDGADAATHDRFRGQPGVFAATLEACATIRRLGLPLTLATTVARHDVHQIDALYALVGSLHPVRWSLFFLVPTGRARAEEMIAAEAAEAVLLRLRRFAADAPFAIKTTEAPAIRRLLLAGGSAPQARATIGDGRGFLFLAANGDICPSGFLPLVAGNVRQDDVLEVYRRHPIFLQMRDPGALRGPRCGRCEYRAVCGGSRSRAYAITGDPLGDDPLCAHVPGAAGGASPSGAAGDGDALGAGVAGGSRSAAAGDAAC